MLDDVSSSRSQDFSATTLDSLPMAAAVVNASGGFEYRNPAWMEQLGPAFCNSVLVRKTLKNTIGQMRHADGDWRAPVDLGPAEFGPGHFGVLRLTRLTGSLTSVLATYRDDRARRQAEAERLQDQELLRGLFYSNPYSMLLADRDGIVERVNDQFDRLFGFSGDLIIGACVFDDPLLREAGLVDRVRTVVDGHVVQLPEFFYGPRAEHVDGMPDGPLKDELRRCLNEGRLRSFWASGTVFPIRDNAGVVARFVITHQDVTEQREAAEVLRRRDQEQAEARRMDSIGVLAGGIAHDFNNMLTVINGYAEMVAKKEKDAKRRGQLERVLDSGQRAAGLASQLLAFARREPLQPRPTDVARVVRASGDMFRRLLGARIRLNLPDGQAPAYALVDQAQFDRAMLNLVMNARDAMPKGGSAEIQVRTFEVGEAGGEVPASLSPGRWVAVCVSDTGVGIPAENLTRIFDPFYTTKEMGRGTGLGLATVFGFAKESGGHVAAESTLGAGTSITLYLPACAEPASTTAPVPLERKPVRIGRTQGTKRGRVLVVDDDHDVAELMARILEVAGYVTQTANGSGAALHLLETSTQPFDLIVTDVIMPVLTGTEMGAHIARANPHQGILYVTAHDDGELRRAGLDPRTTTVLRKPFSSDDFLRAVELVLKDRSGHR